MENFKVNVKLNYVSNIVHMVLSIKIKCIVYLIKRYIALSFPCSGKHMINSDLNFVFRNRTYFERYLQR